MRDWKALANAQGVKIPAGDLDRMVAPLNEMDDIFRSLLPSLEPEIEPAFELRLEASE